MVPEDIMVRISFCPYKSISTLQIHKCPIHVTILDHRSSLKYLKTSEYNFLNFLLAYPINLFKFTFTLALFLTSLSYLPVLPKRKTTRP